MKIRDTQPSIRTHPLRSSTALKKSASVTESVDDEIVISGIPEAELTDSVRKVMSELLGEVRRLREAFEASQMQVAELKILADRDPLVDSLNRRAFVRELDRSLAMKARYAVPSCLVFIDLNDLKVINDTRGHAAGDEALRTVANIVESCTRQTDILGRLGGDEFGLILGHIDRKQAIAKVETLKAMINEAVVSINGEKFPISVAFGIVELASGMDAEQAITTADTQMYVDKQVAKSP